MNTPDDPLAQALFDALYGTRGNIDYPEAVTLAARLREAGVVTKAEVVAAVEGLRRPGYGATEGSAHPSVVNGTVNRVLAAIDRLGETA